MAAIRNHRVLLKIPDLMREQNQLQEWNAISTNLIKMRKLSAHDFPLLMKLTAACEARVAQSIILQHCAEGKKIMLE